MNLHDEDEFLDDQVMPDFEKWQEQERQKSQQKPEPSMWRLVGLVEGKELPMEKVEAYTDKQAVYKLCFDLNRKTKSGKHPLKKGWGKIHAALEKFVTTHKKVNFWVVKLKKEENTMDKKKNNEIMSDNNNKEENKMDKQKNIDEVIAKANATAKETVAQKAVKEQPINEARKAYEAELTAKDALVNVKTIGEVMVQSNTFNVRVFKDEKRTHSFNVFNQNGVKVAAFTWGKALLPNITVMRNDEFGINFDRLRPYQEGEDLKVDEDYVSLATVIFGSNKAFAEQLRAEQNRRVDEQELAAQQRQAREEFFAKRNAEQMEAMAQREQERQDKLAAAKEAWKASELIDFTSIYNGKEISLVARYLKSVDEKGNDIVKAIIAHRGANKGFARFSWNTFFGGPCLTVTMKDDIWSYIRDEKDQPIVDENGKPQIKWDKVERRHELYMAKNGNVVKRGAYNKEVQATEAEKNTYVCLCFGLAAALNLPQPGPKAARYPISDEEFFAGLEDSPVKPLRRI